MTTPTASKIYTIPFGVSFADALAEGILDRYYDADDPLSLCRVTLFVPTRRAGRTVREAFLRKAAGKPLLMPRLRPLGDVTDDDLIADMATEAEMGFGAEKAFEIPPAVSPLERHIILTRFVMTWLVSRATDHDLPPTIETAARLANALGQFIDTAHTENAKLENLHALAGEDFADHWNEVLDCLKVVTDQWPALLKRRNLIDATERRNRMLAALSEQWQRDPPTDPIIVAGSTGSVPATAELMAVISRLPQGMLILPALDTAMDDEEWKAVPESHPQYGMRRLLDRLKEPRATVQPWPYGNASDSLVKREAIVNEVMRAPDATADWAQASTRLGAHMDDGLAGVSALELAGPRDEALAIAMLLREALEEDSKTAALVTPDRALARRVAEELKRWDIDIDDSAGLPLMRSPVALYVQLIAQVVAEKWAPVPLVALLNHPLAGLGLSRAARLQQVADLERQTLRGERPEPGANGLRARLAAEKHANLHQLIERIETALAPLSQFAEGAHDAAVLLDAHILAAETLAHSDDREGPDRLWVGEAGELMAQQLAGLREHATLLGEISLTDWVALLPILLGSQAVRPRRNNHPRLQILGPLEIRLQSADLVVLGGLNEGVWPRATAADPWMSRAMRTAFGLEAPERQIGQSAHDFTQALGAPQIVMTRAKKQDGAPAVASRWWLRFETLLSAAGRPLVADDRLPVQHWVETLDNAPYQGGAGAPKPCPPVEKRPRHLSATQIKTWVRDPYSIYARHVLGLRKLDPLDADLEPSTRGTWVHEALEAVMKQFPGALPDQDVLQQAILEEGRNRIGTALADPELRAFWWPRFERIARYIGETEAERRLGNEDLRLEIKGTMQVAGPLGPFTITAEADRIDQKAGGNLVISDYKTGTTSTVPQVQQGFDPQLPIEALIARNGGFDEVDGSGQIGLRYITITGSTKQPGLDRDAAEGGRAKLTTAQVIDDTEQGLLKRIAAYDDPATPYVSRPLPQFRFKDFGDYDDLARVGEWAGESDGDGESGGEG